MNQILFLRHSESVANAKSLMAGGLTDAPLTSSGREIAREKGVSLLEASFMPTRVYTSTLSRTVETAKIILDELGTAKQIQILKSLDERTFGAYEGKEYDHLMEAFDEYGPNPPTVENVDSFIERVLAGFGTIKKQADGDVLVVAHSNVLAVIHCALFEPERMGEYRETYHAKVCEGFFATV